MSWCTCWPGWRRPRLALRWFRGAASTPCHLLPPTPMIVRAEKKAPSRSLSPKTAGARKEHTLLRCALYKCKINPVHLLQRKHAVEITNEETMRNYGPLPPGGLPVQKKTRPDVPYRDFRENLVARTSLIEEEDEMKLGLVTAMTAMTISGVILGDKEQLQQNAIANSVVPITRTTSSIDEVQTIEVRNELPFRSAQSPAGEKKLIFHELALAAGVDCKEPDTGLACSAGDYEAGDYYEVKLSPKCGQDGPFAAVTNKKGTALLDRVPPKDTISPATLSEGQLVCIQATALIKGTPSWYYVRVVPADSLQGSARNRLLATHGGREVWWHAKHEGGACRLDEPWEFSGACAVGWADAGDFDVFSNGP